MAGPQPEHPAYRACVPCPSPAAGLVSGEPTWDEFLLAALGKHWTRKILC
jgi:hypothetical protein